MSTRAAPLLCALALAACDGDHAPAAPPEASVESPPDIPPDMPPASAPVEDFVEWRYPGQPGKPRVLVYTFENVWHHFSMLALRGALIAMNTTRGYTIVLANHPLAVNAKTLADIDVIVFCVTSGSGLTAQSKADVEAWVRAGGGMVGFHSATFTESFWPFYVANIGTTFATHAPGVYRATVELSPEHPITAGLPDLELDDEWYIFSQRPENIPGAQMLITVDEDTLPADFPAVNKQGYHAIGWANDRFGGRMFYTALGHLPETFNNPTVLEIVARSIEWTAHQPERGPSEARSIGPVRSSGTAK